MNKSSVQSVDQENRWGLGLRLEEFQQKWTGGGGYLEEGLGSYGKQVN